RAARLDAVIWRDIDAWLNDPGPILHRLAEQLRAKETEVEALEAERAGVLASIMAKQDERAFVVSAGRRKVITEREMERELGTVADEVRALEERLGALSLKLASEQERRDRLAGVEALLGRLREA